MTTRSPETAQEVEDATLYHISFEKLAELKRSPTALLAARRCPSCPSLDTPLHELTSPEELAIEIGEYCGGEEGFIQSDMPLQEIVFRILLARRNQPTSLHDLHYQLTEQWATPRKPMNISSSALRRILDVDTYYGFAPVSAESKQPAIASP